MSAPESSGPTEPQDAINERAALLFERKHFGEWSPRDQDELEGWLAESILHEVAFLRLKGHAARAERLAALRPFRRSNEWVETFKDTLRPFAIPVLAMVALVVFARLGLPYLLSLGKPPERSYATEIGGRATLKFADGTVVDLNTDTSVRFKMTSAERTVWLEKGEAWFHVAHDVARPFTVVVGRQRVTDLGTEFDVRRELDATEVALLAGKAALSSEGAPAAMLKAGDDAVVTTTRLSVTHRSTRELNDHLAWRRGMLVFRDARLADAVREFNRYNSSKLVIADPSIADLKFSAEIRNDNLQGFVHVAQSLLNLRADQHGSDIWLSRGTIGKVMRARRAARDE